MTMITRASITISDLAARLGVTHSTVSRALAPGRGRSRVSPANRERIARLARKLGYRPNAVARNLVCRRTYSIGVIVRHFNDPFFSDMIQELHVNLTRRNYLGVFFSARDKEEFQHAVDSLVTRRVEGVISMSLTPEEQRRILKIGVPIVCYSSGAGRGICSVGVTPGQGIVRAMAHLQELGHRKIGFIGRTENKNLRFHGFRRFLRRERLPSAEAWIRSLDGAQLNRDVGGVFRNSYEQMLQLLALPDRPTAVICHNDVAGMGAQRAVLAQGLKVPDDMALVGFDNLREGAYAAVPLTSVDPHLDRIAKLMTDLVIEQVEHPSRRRPSVRIRVEPTLVVRESTMGRFAPDGVSPVGGERVGRPAKISEAARCSQNRIGKKMEEH